MQGKKLFVFPVVVYYIDWAGVFAWCEFFFLLYPESNKNIFSSRKIKSEKLGTYPEKLIFRITEITFIFLMTKLLNLDVLGTIFPVCL